MRTVTFDETKFAIVPLEPTISMVNALMLAADNTYYSDMVRDVIAVAPPYPESNCKEILDRWIPCSERLPDTSRKVIAYYKNEYGKDRQVMAFHAGKFDVESGSDDEHTDYCERGDTYYLPEGWHEVIENWDDYSSVAISCEITHWKERCAYPEAPKVEE